MTDHFEASKNAPATVVNGDDVISYVTIMLKNAIPFRKKRQVDPSEELNEYGKYLDHVETLAVRTDQMLKKVEHLADENMRELAILYGSD